MIRREHKKLEQCYFLWYCHIVHFVLSPTSNNPFLYSIFPSHHNFPPPYLCAFCLWLLISLILSFFSSFHSLAHKFSSWIFLHLPQQFTHSFYAALHVLCLVCLTVVSYVIFSFLFSLEQYITLQYFIRSDCKGSSLSLSFSLFHWYFSLFSPSCKAVQSRLISKRPPSIVTNSP